MIDRCPLCQARLSIETICPRCQADLTLSLQCVAQADYYYQQAIKALFERQAVAEAQHYLEQAKLFRQDQFTLLLEDFIIKLDKNAI